MQAVNLLGFSDAEMLRRAITGQVRRFVYRTAVTAVPVSTTVQATISVESATDFVCNMFCARVFYGTGAVLGAVDREVDPFVTPWPRIELVDQASGSSMFDRADTWAWNAFGTSLQPMILGQPHRFSARTVITAFISNISTVDAIRVQVALHGYKQKTGAF